MAAGAVPGDDAPRRAEDAADRAERAEEGAERAEAGAGLAEAGAERAEAGAGRAELAAEHAEAQAERAAEEAVEVAQQADVLLIEEDARRVAAQVSDEQPFGLPGAPLNRRSDLRRGFVVTTGTLIALLVAYALVAVRHELLLLLVSAFVAIGLDPAVRWLVARGLSRGLAVAVIALTALAMFAGFVIAAVPPIVDQASQFIDSAPHYVQQLQDQHNVIGRFNAKYHIAESVQRSVKGGLTLSTADGVLKAGTALISFTFKLLLVLVLVVYFLADLPKIKAAFYRLAPLHRRPRVGLLGDEIISRVGGYVLGNVATSLVAIAASYILLAVLNVPHALVLSIFTGVLDLIPLVGSSIAGALVALVALATVSPTAAVITVVFHVVYRVFEDYLLNPRVLRKTVDVSPLVTVVAVVIGGAMLGIVGALVAVPAAAAIQLILTEVVYPVRDAEQPGDREPTPVSR